MMYPNDKAKEQSVTQMVNEAISEAMATGEESVVHICQGPPRCELMGDEAIKAQSDGCPFCDRVFVYADGTCSIKKVSEV
jgi:uncharacterized Zn-finger protein